MNERFRVSIRLNERLTLFDHELALGLPSLSTLIVYNKKESKVSFLFAQMALDMDFFGKFRNA